MPLPENIGTVETLAVWRTAQDIIIRYPQESELAACHIAEDAFAESNMWDFKLWQSVAKAVRKLAEPQ